MIEAFGLQTPPLDVGPDRSRRLGLSRMCAEDLLQLEAGMPPHSEKSKCAIT
jgi:hypothetical protein